LLQLAPAQHNCFPRRLFLFFRQGIDKRILLSIKKSIKEQKERSRPIRLFWGAEQKENEGQEEKKKKKIERTLRRFLSFLPHSSTFPAPLLPLPNQEDKSGRILDRREYR
jgi:hypothetical protein